MSTIIYSIAGLTISISTNSEMAITKSFIPFLQSASGSNLMQNTLYQVELQEVFEIPNIIGTRLMKNQDFSVFQDKDGNQMRLYHDHDNGDKPYALTEYDLEAKKIRIRFLPEGKRFFTESGNSFFHIGWEKILVCEQRILLHASCVETKLGGILFSGPSGIGKSTQANLWCRYENAKLINGDRAILRKEDSEWIAYGSPYAGSSKCYVNDKCLVKAIMILKQASKCSIRRLNGMEAFRKVYEGLTINSWDKQFVVQVCDIVMEMLTEIPVYELECVPDKSAVDILKKELEG